MQQEIIMMIARVRPLALKFWRTRQICKWIIFSTIILLFSSWREKNYCNFKLYKRRKLLWVDKLALLKLWKMRFGTQSEKNSILCNSKDLIELN